MSLAPGSAAELEELDSLALESIQSELTNWQRIVFYGAMEGSSNSLDKGKDQSTRPTLTVPSTSAPSIPHNESNPRTFPTTVPQPPHNNPLITTPPHVAPEAYNYLINALLAMQQSAAQQQHPQPTENYPYAMPPGQYTQPGPPTYGWSIPPGGALPMSNINGTSTGIPSMYPHNPTPLFQNAVPQMMTPVSQSATQYAASSTSVGENPDQAEEAISTAEDKRRRNTAASARFRVKKKLKALNLERTVADLTGRTEELEREAADLRRENGWLKEIILLKSRNVGGFGSTASQPVELASAGPRELQESNSGGSSSGQGNGGEKGKGKKVG